VIGLLCCWVVIKDPIITSVGVSLEVGCVGLPDVIRLKLGIFCCWTLRSQSSSNGDIAGAAEGVFARSCEHNDIEEEDNCLGSSIEEGLVVSSSRYSCSCDETEL